MNKEYSYEELKDTFTWADAEKELGYSDGDEINIGWYLTDRICNIGKADKTALIWEGHTGEKKRYSFDDIRELSDSIAHFLREDGIEAGDRICLFMDRVPELYYSFPGILKMGGVVQPLFSAFGGDSLKVRLEDASTKAVFTQQKFLSRLRKIREQLPELRTVYVLDYDGKKALKDFEKPLLPETLKKPEDFKVYPSVKETPSVLHYTSGTTGQPKGALHVHYSIISQYITSKYVLDLKEDDIYWCTADPGWVTGISYGIIGPWANGTTMCIMDAGFKPESWYRFMEENRVTVWYSAPTAIRSLMKEGREVIEKYDLSALRHLASVGEPLNAEAVIWSTEVFGNTFHDTYWQTETGAMIITNFPGMKIKPGSMGKPFPGIEAAVLDFETMEPVNEAGKAGLIAVKPGWPSMFREYWNNRSVYDSKFVNEWYVCGDRGSIDKEGYFWFVGRDDDVINTGGHLVGPFEIESALLEHEAVAESAVIGKPDPVNMEVVKAVIALNEGYEASEEMELKIMNFIRKKLSPLAMPQDVEFVDKLPKTRSGKILRRVLKAKEWGEDPGDLSTLED